jgi:hypothetical protein
VKGHKIVRVVCPSVKGCVCIHYPRDCFGNTAIAEQKRFPAATLKDNLWKPRTWICVDRRDPRSERCSAVVGGIVIDQLNAVRKAIATGRRPKGVAIGSYRAAAPTTPVVDL